MTVTRTGEWWTGPALVLVAGLNALCYPLIVLGSAYAPHLTFASLRAVTAGLALAVIATVLRRPLPRGAQTWIALGGIGLGATTLGYLGMFYAAEFVSPGLATIFSNSQPLIAAVLARAFLSERLGAVQYLGLAFGFLGILGISFDQLRIAGDPEFSIAVGYIMLAVIGVAVSNVLMKAVRSTVDPLVAMASQSLIGALPLVAMAFVFEHPWQIQATPAFVLVLLGLAFPGTALAYWLWFSVLDRVPLGRANAFTFLTPFIALAIGIMFFDEHAGSNVIGGLLLTALGIFLVEGITGRSSQRCEPFRK